MMHKAWCSIEEVPYCFPRPSIKFQGHKGQKIDDLDQIWARLLGRSQLSNPSDLPCLFLSYFSVLPYSMVIIRWKCHVYRLVSTGGHINVWLLCVLGPVSISSETSYCREVSKPRDLVIWINASLWIWQARRQQCCRGACQISEQLNRSKYNTSRLKKFARS